MQVVEGCSVSNLLAAMQVLQLFDCETHAYWHATCITKNVA